MMEVMEPGWSWLYSALARGLRTVQHHASQRTMMNHMSIHWNIFRILMNHVPFIEDIYYYTVLICTVLKELGYMFWGASDMFAAIHAASACLRIGRTFWGSSLKDWESPCPTRSSRASLMKPMWIMMPGNLRKDSYGEKTWCMIDYDWLTWLINVD